MTKQAHADRAHARLSPSKADQWMTCTASISFVESLGIEDSSSAAADEGTAAHELLDLSLKEGKPPIKYLGRTFNKKWKATREMCEAVDQAYSWIMDYVWDGYELIHEQYVTISATGEGGTLDVCLVKRKLGYVHIVIADYKHGRGVKVEAAENKQMRLYMLGVIEKLKLRQMFESNSLELSQAILQPRVADGINHWIDDCQDLLQFERDAIKARNAINKGKTSFVTSEKGCKWCPARGQCKAFAEKAMEAAKQDFASVVSKDCKTATVKGALTPKELAQIIRNIDGIRDALKAFEARGFQLALKQQLPGFKVVQAQGNRKWKDDTAVSNALAKLGFDESDYTKQALAGITVISDLFKDKKKRDTFLNKHTVKGEGKPALVLDTDPRQALNAADEFNDVPTTETEP